MLSGADAGEGLIEARLECRASSPAALQAFSAAAQTHWFGFLFSNKVEILKEKSRAIFNQTADPLSSSKK